MNHAPILPIVYIGIDVSAKWLDLAGLPRLKRLPNTAAAHAKLARSLTPHSHVIMEASGGYEHALWIALLEAGITVSRINPGRVRHFARATQKLAKTDTLDAALLVSFGQHLKPRADVLPSPQLQQLQSLVSRREQLVQNHALQQTQCKQLRDKALQAQARKLMDYLQRQIQSLEKSMSTLIEGSEGLKLKAKRLQQLPGIGIITSATLLAQMPELGEHEDQQICALAGLAPHPYDSGPMKGLRRIQGGRERVRRVLYMAAVCSLKRNAIFKTFYQNLRKRGKPAKVALTAIMRKILCLLNKMIAKPDFTLAS